MPTTTQGNYTFKLLDDLEQGGTVDSANLSSDGRELLFFAHPNKWFGSSTYEENVAAGSGDIWKSRWPFKKRSVLDYISDPNDQLWEHGPHVDAAGDIHYGQTSLTTGQTLILKEGVIVPLPISNPNNPHHCLAKSELWYHDETSHTIWINDQPAPAPINLPGVWDFQPWLTQDGEELYFSSNRDAPTGQVLPIHVYRSYRNGGDWTEPEAIVTSPVAVGEFTMSADRSRFVVVEAFIDPATGNLFNRIFLATASWQL